MTTHGITIPKGNMPDFVLSATAAITYVTEPETWPQFIAYLEEHHPRRRRPRQAGRRAARRGASRPGPHPGLDSGELSVTAHVMDESRVQAQWVAQRTANRDRTPDRGKVARDLVRSWSPAQRARVRVSMLQLRHFGSGEGERDVLDLIDQVESGA